MSNDKQSKAQIALSKLTPSTHGRGTIMPITEWVQSLIKDGYVQIPVYHSTSQREGDFKSQKVRVALLVAVPKFYYHHATDKAGFRYLFIMRDAAGFKELKWNYTEAVREEVK